MKTAAVILLAMASLVARAESFPVVSYTLDAGSTYQEGCYDPCDCLLGEEQPMNGTFDLVFYPFAGPIWTVAVENVDWNVPMLDKHLEGQGLYRRAGDQHDMYLDVEIDGNPPVAFDSGWAAGGAAYPAIDLTLSMHGLVCYDIALHVRAKPVDDPPLLALDRGQLTWSVTAGAPTFDVLRGDLIALRTSGGDFGPTVDTCLADDLFATTLTEDALVDPGAAVWFLVRRAVGSFDSGDLAQVGSRDAEIASSSFACP